MLLLLCLLASITVAQAEEFEKLAVLSKELKKHTPSVEACLKISAAIHESAIPLPRTEFGPVMDINDLAEYLRVDVETVEEYLDEMPCFEFGGVLRFRRKSIDEWIERRELSFRRGRIGSETITLLPADRVGGSKWTA